MPSPQGRSSRTTLDEAADHALASAAAAVGDRWSLLVVARLLNGPRRFGELLDELDGLAPNIRARRLARMLGARPSSSSSSSPNRRGPLSRRATTSSDQRSPTAAAALAKAWSAASSRVVREERPCGEGMVSDYSDLQFASE